MRPAALPLGRGLYFLDVLACLLFCLALALVGARFGREHSVAIDSASGPPASGAGSELSGLEITIDFPEGRGGPPRYQLGRRVVSLAELSAQLERSPPAAVVLRAAASPLAELIGVAHAAGVHDIELAYGSRSGAHVESTR